MNIETPKGLEAAERETVMQWDDESRMVILWTAQAPIIRKMARLGIAPHAERRRQSGTLHGYEYRIPLARFRWGLKRTGTPLKGRFLPKTPREEASSGTVGAKP